MGVAEGSEMCWEQGKLRFRNILWHAINGDDLGDELIW